MNAGLALDCFSGIRRVQGRIWEVVGRKGPNPEQHGRVSRVSVSSWEGPRGGQESVGRPVEALWMELGWFRWTRWPTNKDSFGHNHGVDLMTEERQGVTLSEEARKDGSFITRWHRTLPIFTCSPKEWEGVWKRGEFRTVWLSIQKRF